MTQLKAKLVDEQTIKLLAIETAEQAYASRGLDNITVNVPAGENDPANALMTRWFAT